MSLLSSIGILIAVNAATIAAMRQRDLDRDVPGQPVRVERLHFTLNG